MEFPITFNDITIRPEELKDYTLMKPFHDKLIEEKALIGRKSKRTTKEWKESIMNALALCATKKAVTLVAEKETQIIAMSGIFLEAQKMDHVASFGLMIDKNYRNIGLGTKLSQIIMKYAQEIITGLECIELGVTSNNFPAQSLYQKLGFHTVAVIPKKIKHFGTYLDEYIMQKWL